MKSSRQSRQAPVKEPVPVGDLLKETRGNEKTSTKCDEEWSYEKAKKEFWKQANNYTLETRGCRYEVDEENREVIEALIQYYCRDEDFLKNGVVKNSPEHFKCLWIGGNVGSGKDLLMEILQRCPFVQHRYKIRTTTEMNRLYAQSGYPGIAEFANNAVVQYNPIHYKHCLFSDLGEEDQLTAHFQNSINVMKYIISERYQLWIKYSLMTHITTNLTLDEVKQRYGERIYSRVMEQFNILILGDRKDSKDRRV